MTPDYAPPTKRSVLIAGHQTSISLEPIFWAAVEGAAAARNLPLSALVAAIDHARIQGEDPPNLASAIRSWLMGNLSTKQSQAQPGALPDRE